MPQVVSKKAAASVLESPLIQKHEKYTEHEVPNICVKMKDEFMKVSLKKPHNIGVLTSQLTHSYQFNSNCRPSKTTWLVLCRSYLFA